MDPSRSHRLIHVINTYSLIYSFAINFPYIQESKVTLSTMRTLINLLTQIIIQNYTLRLSKCELMKLSEPFVSYMYADAAFTVAAPKYTFTVFPVNYGPCHHLLHLNADYIHICYHYNVFFLNLLLFVYLFIYLFYYFNLTHINVYRFY